MAAQEQHFNECFADIVNLLNVCEEKYPAGLKHRSQVRSGHRSGHRSGQVTGHRSQVTGQVNRKNIFLQRKLTIFLRYFRGLDNVNWPPYRDFGGRTSYLLLGLYHASVK